jgi:hypothetical protein
MQMAGASNATLQYAASRKKSCNTGLAQHAASRTLSSRCELESTPTFYNIACSEHGTAAIVLDRHLFLGFLCVD